MTDREREAFKWIKAFIKAEGHSPSVRELQHGLGLKSAQPAHLYLTKLRARGLVEWEDGKPRTLRVVKGARA